MELMLDQIKLSREAGLTIKVLMEKTPSRLKIANSCWYNLESCINWRIF